MAGTGLRLSSTVRWMAQGNYATADIHKSHVSQCCFPLPAVVEYYASGCADDDSLVQSYLLMKHSAQGHWSM